MEAEHFLMQPTNKPTTAREHARAMRLAFVSGAIFGREQMRRSPRRANMGIEAADQALSLYPVPTKIVPRIVVKTDIGSYGPNQVWAFSLDNEGVLLYICGSADQQDRLVPVYPFAEQLARVEKTWTNVAGIVEAALEAFAQLKASPSMEVEDDG